MMNIVVSFDQSPASLPAGFTSAVASVVAFYQSQFTDNITFNLHVGFGEVHGSALSPGALGQSFWFLNSFSYTALRNALVADQKSNDDATALGNVPATDPLGGTHTYWAAQVQAKALGLLSNSVVVDTYVGFSSTAAFDYDRSDGITAGQFDFFGTVAHEVAEVMGKNLLVGATIGTTSNSYVLSDLFHFSSPGVRDFSGTTPGYFSIDLGNTNLDNFNTNPGGDFGDWASSAGNDSWRAFSNSSVINAVTETDLRFLDVIGFDRVPAGNPAPPPATTADMILRRGSDGHYDIYDIGNNTLLAAFNLGQVGTEWKFVGLGGFLGNDTTDMMLRNSNTGGFEIYDIRNNNIVGAAFLGNVGTEWQFAGFGNFGSLGETDMLLRNSNNGGFEVYDIRDNQITGTNFLGNVGLNWQVAGFGDFSSRGTSDMILRDTQTGGLEVYDIDHNQITGAAFMGTVGLEWQALGVGNFSSRGTSDMIMRNSNTGAMVVFDINNNQITSTHSLGSVGLEWQFAGVGPMHAPGASDLVLRNVNTGQFVSYIIMNDQIVGAGPLGQVGLERQLGGFAPIPAFQSAASSEPSPIAHSEVGFASGDASFNSFLTDQVASSGSGSQVARLAQAMASFGNPLDPHASNQAWADVPSHVNAIAHTPNVWELYT